MIAYHGEPTARSSVLKMLRACLSQFFLPCLCSDRLSGSLVLSLLKSFFPLRAVSELALSLSLSFFVEKGERSLWLVDNFGNDTPSDKKTGANHSKFGSSPYQDDNVREREEEEEEIKNKNFKKKEGKRRSYNSRKSPRIAR